VGCKASKPTNSMACSCPHIKSDEPYVSHRIKRKKRKTPKKEKKQKLHALKRAFT
jgi:hypothetical protein